MIKNDPVWSVQLALKCPEEDLSHAFESHSMIDNGIIGIGFGAYLGIVYQAKRRPGAMNRRLNSY